MKLFPGLTLVLSLIGTCIHAQTTTRIDWKSDIEVLKKELPLRHSDLYFHQSKKWFETQLKAIQSSLGSLSDATVAVRLQQLIAGIGDSHTTAEIAPFLKAGGIIPLQLYLFDDGYHVLASSEPALTGSKIEKVNGYPIGRVMDSINTLLVAENPSVSADAAPGLFLSDALLNVFKLNSADGSVIVEGIDASGTPVKATLHPDNKLDLKYRVRPQKVGIGYQNERAVFWDKYVAEDSILFIQYNKCWSRELERKYGDSNRAAQLPSFTEFEQHIVTVLHENPVKKLIIDMRYNRGGSSAQGLALAALLKGQDINRRGRLFVLTGRRTYSSAVLNVMDFREQTSAILVGEETSGSPNHFGEVKSFELPSSHLRIIYSTRSFHRAPEGVHTITPDVPVLSRYEDLMSGTDAAYEAVKKY